MMKKLQILNKYDVIVIGSGPGGVAAAISAKEIGADNVLIIERDVEPGGILLQCIHNGFGLEMFGEDLPGPSYAQFFIEESYKVGVQYLLDSMVLDISPELKVTVTSKEHGYLTLEAGAVVLAMGCRERTRAQIRIPGPRPTGVYTAGTAQRWVNMEGYLPGENAVILGSGDIGLIMARRMTFEGAKVSRVVELMPFINGLTRNYVQCLLDFDIPLQLSHTVKRIIGKDRVEAVETARVDEDWNFVPGSEEIIPCDTLLLSVGLIPENELSRTAGVVLDPVTGGPVVDDHFQTNVPGIFAAGNVVHVYDLADWVSKAGGEAGAWAARYALQGGARASEVVLVRAGDGIRYVVPQLLRRDSLDQGEVPLQMRVTRPIEERVQVQVWDGEILIAKKTEQYVRPGEMVEVRLKPAQAEMVRNARELNVVVVKP